MLGSDENDGSNNANMNNMNQSSLSIRDRDREFRKRRQDMTRICLLRKHRLLTLKHTKPVILLHRLLDRGMSLLNPNKLPPSSITLK